MRRNRDQAQPLMVYVRARCIGTVAAALVAAACSSSVPTSAVSAKPSLSPRPAAAVAHQLCFTNPPADWSAALSQTVASLTGVDFGVGAVDDQDGLAFGEAWTASRSSLASINLSTGQMTTIAPMSSKGFGWMVFGDGWVAWPQVGLGGSSIQLWNATTHERRQIATSGPPGTPAIGHGYLVWNETATDSTGALRVYRFATDDTLTLDSGLVYSPVFAAGFLVWIKQPGSGPPSPSTAQTPPPQTSFVFADARTLQPVAAPIELRQAREIDFLAGSPDKLLWSDHRAWFLDDLAAGVISSYTTAPGHYLQFPELAEPYLAWFGADRNSIIDLRTGIGFDVPLPGGVAVAGDTIVVVSSAVKKGTAGRSDISVLHPSQLSPLSSCSA